MVYLSVAAGKKSLSNEYIYIYIFIWQALNIYGYLSVKTVKMKQKSPQFTKHPKTDYDKGIIQSYRLEINDTQCLH